MRRSRILAGVVLLAAFAWSLYDWVVVDQGVRYFSQDYRRILVLLAIVAVGAPLLLGYESLSAEWKRRMSLWVLGSLAVGTTGFAIHVIWTMTKLAGFLSEMHQFWTGMVASFFPTVLAVCLWWAFSRIWCHRTL